jgi:hypothetical protein
MCNSYNHSWDCTCGFGGDTGGGGRGGWRSRSSFAASYAIRGTASGGWVKDRDGTVASYINPNAHCPVCGESVFFYRSPYDGRVFFDQLGWPWPKHRCTDNSGYIRRKALQSVAADSTAAEPVWRSAGWQPLLSAKVYSDKERLLLTGDGPGGFLELHLQRAALIDRDSPIFVRELVDRPGMFEATFLRSDGFATLESKAIAFQTRVSGAGEDAILKAAANEADALNAIGQFFLWSLDEPDMESARPYLEAAAALGHVQALIDLAVIAMMSAKRP